MHTRRRDTLSVNVLTTFAHILPPEKKKKKEKKGKKKEKEKKEKKGKAQALLFDL